MAKSKRKGIEVSIALAEAVKLSKVDVISAYPITPQTHVVEHLSEFVADGELDAEYIPVESEHTAMSACVGAAAAGARTFTSTAAQGLALMHEILFIASGLRLPIVMALANRSMSAPLSIWNDHSDVMAERDCGWIQLFVENGQEATDFTIQAFRIGEDRRVSLPVMVNFDGFIMSHVIEPIEIPAQEDVDRYLPAFKPLRILDVRKPISIGPVGIPDIYMEAHMAQEDALRKSLDVVLESWKEFEKVFGRRYEPIMTYDTKDADIIFVVAGALTESIRTVVRQLRKKGEKVGVASVKLWRPFPFDHFYRAVSRARVIAVVDRALSFGGPGGPMASEIKSFLYEKKEQPAVVEFICGLGGRDLPFGDIERMHARAKAVLRGGAVPKFEIVGLRA
jgi:pyruvate ferredoxin oxidoreductase alpha subunit